ncbi:MAG: zinc-ribbon domain-containing protein [Roseovarius sp.]|nr:zinc-ribbon domain-containing protein [Roseovarius sp.]
MRLTCPKCTARYEVPDTAIPTEGREVQCSDCGTTWFQPHPDHPTGEVGAAPPAMPPEAAPESAPESAPAPRPIAPEIVEILRAEAERERAARASEADAPPRARPDPGPDDIAPGETGPPAHDTPPDSTAPPSRRDLLPDIEAINSSLSAAAGPGMAAPRLTPSEAARAAPRRRRGFRVGFWCAVLVCVLALIVYLTAPRIAAFAPGLEGVTGQYVAAVDALRAILSEAVAGLLERF